jgi:hypothetical protein
VSILAGRLRPLVIAGAKYHGISRTPRPMRKGGIPHLPLLRFAFDRNLRSARRLFECYVSWPWIVTKYRRKVTKFRRLYRNFDTFRHSCYRYDTWLMVAACRAMQWSILAMQLPQHQCFTRYGPMRKAQRWRAVLRNGRCVQHAPASSGSTRFGVILRHSR